MSDLQHLYQNDGFGNHWPSPLAPVLTPPSGTLLNTLLSLTFIVSPLAIDNGAPDTALSSILEVRTAPAGGGTLIYSGNPVIGAMTLPASQTLYARAQTRGALYGVSPWSPSVQINT